MTAHVMYRQDPSDLFDGSDEGYLSENPTPVWSCWGPDYNFSAMMDDNGTAVPVVSPDEAEGFSGIQQASLLIVNSTPDSAALSAAKAAQRFFVLAQTAASHGGFWVSAAGGTANVVAGEISRAIGVSFTAAHRALDAVGGSDWYQELAEMQPWPIMEIPYDHDTDQWLCRWDARTIARAAVRPLRQST